MCSRFELETTLDTLIADIALNIAPSDEQAHQARAFERGEVRPTNLAPVILPGRTLAWLPWGLSVDWQNQPVINARSETLHSKPTFKPLLARRCLVPATAYIEWRAAGKLKIKTRIRVDNADVFSFAGLVGDGRFTIVTCTPATSIAHIHDRMPVILDRGAQELWLSERPYDGVKSVLVPFGGNLKFEELAPPPHRQGELAL